MTSTVVVGVDGSVHAQHALEWAAQYAEMTNSTIRAVIAWHIPASAAFASIDGLELEQAAAAALEESVKAVQAAHPSLKIETAVEPGLAAQVLLDAARTADLLVLGSRGHGAFAGMLLGSVSTHCVHHARCPVVVVPGEER